MTYETYTPLWWISRLEQALFIRRYQMQLMDDYYTGLHPLPFVTKAHNAKMRDEFKGLLEDSRSNFMRLVVDSCEERLRVDGFRLSADSDAQADAASWKIWQANGMDAESQVAFNEALIKGVSYLSVWKDAGTEYPTIAVEDPMETIVAYTAGSNFRKRDAALKVWTDEWTGDVRATLYLPDSIRHYVRPGVTQTSLTVGTLAGMKHQVPPWVPFTAGHDDDGVTVNPYGIVPIIPLRNRGRLRVEGESEIVDLTYIQDRINGELFMRTLAGYFGAHRQRWAVGLRLMEDETTGEPVEPFDVAIDRLWQTEDPNVQFGEFSQTDLSGYIKAIEQDVLHIAVASRTPRHYLIEQGQSPSGDAIQSAEAGLDTKVLRKQRPFGECLEDAMRLARLMAGEPDAPVDSEIVWSDTRIRTEAQVTDAVVKQFEANLIPWEAALEKLGYSATQIRRFAAMRQRDQLMARVQAAAVNANPLLGTPPLKSPGGPGYETPYPGQAAATTQDMPHMGVPPVKQATASAAPVAGNGPGQ